MLKIIKYFFWGPAILAAFFVYFCRLSWRKWPDLFVDYGHELYIPWQILSGKVLYRDLAHLQGPFSHYFNSAVLKFVGVSFLNLSILNLILLIFLVILIFYLFKKALGEFTATMVGAVFLSLFAFSQFVSIGNYNYVSPYAHEASHSIILSVTVIFFLMRSYHLKNRNYLLFAGLFCGCVFLTKMEVFLAITAVVITFFMLEKVIKEKKDSLVDISFFFFGSSVPITMIIVYFLFIGFAEGAYEALLGMWMNGGGIAKNKFYLNGLGLDAPLKNFILMVKEYCVFGSIVGLSVIFGKAKTRHSASSWIPFFIFILLLFYAKEISWGETGRSLPLLVLSGVFFLVVDILKDIRCRKKINDGKIFLILWGIFSLVLLLKMILNARFYHYGFYLAMPGILFLIAFLLGIIPSRFSSRSRQNIVKIFYVGMIVVAAFQCHQIQMFYYKYKNLPVGQGGDQMLSWSPRYSPKAEIAVKFLAWIDENVPSDATMVVLPGVGMFNYLTQRVNPTPFYDFTYPVFLKYGERRILNAFWENPPDYIVLLHKSPFEFGVNFFGQDVRYGQEILRWVQSSYKGILVAGYEPLKDGRFGIKLLKRKN